MMLFLLLLLLLLLFLLLGINSWDLGRCEESTSVLVLVLSMLQLYCT